MLNGCNCNQMHNSLQSCLCIIHACQPLQISNISLCQDPVRRRRPINDCLHKVLPYLSINVLKVLCPMLQFTTVIRRVPLVILDSDKSNIQPSTANVNHIEYGFSFTIQVVGCAACVITVLFTHCRYTFDCKGILGA